MRTKARIQIAQRLGILLAIGIGACTTEHMLTAPQPADLKDQAPLNFRHLTGQALTDLIAKFGSHGVPISDGNPRALSASDQPRALNATGECEVPGTIACAGLDLEVDPGTGWTFYANVWPSDYQTPMPMAWQAAGFITNSVSRLNTIVIAEECHTSGALSCPKADAWLDICDTAKQNGTALVEYEVVWNLLIHGTSLSGAATCQPPEYGGGDGAEDQCETKTYSEDAWDGDTGTWTYGGTYDEDICI